MIFIHSYVDGTRIFWTRISVVNRINCKKGPYDATKSCIQNLKSQAQYMCMVVVEVSCCISYLITQYNYTTRENMGQVHKQDIREHWKSGLRKSYFTWARPAFYLHADIQHIQHHACHAIIWNSVSCKSINKRRLLFIFTIDLFIYEMLNYFQKIKV